MKPHFIIGTVAAVVIAVGAATVVGVKQVNKPTSTPTPVAVVSPTPTATPNYAALFTVSDTSASYVGQSGMTSVTGSVKNNDTVAHTVQMTATFFKKDGTIESVIHPEILNLQAGDTQTFTMTDSQAVTDLTSLKVVVSGMN